MMHILFALHIIVFFKVKAKFYNVTAASKNEARLKSGQKVTQNYHLITITKVVTIPEALYRSL
jgi:hypothetical protein